MFSFDQTPKFEVTVEKDQVFTETEEVFFSWAGNITVDGQDRLFIQTGSEMGKASVLAFNTNGDFIKKIGRYGRGPGEFEYIYDIKADSTYLYIYEDYEIHVFQLSDLSHSHTIGLELESLKKESVLRGLRPRYDIFIRNDGTYILSFVNSLQQKVKGGKQYKYYSKMNSEGDIYSNPILKVEDFEFFNTSTEEHLPDPLPFEMPFSRSTLVAVDRSGFIYSNWTEHFLIKIHDSSGEYLRAIYYPFSKATLSESEAYALTNSRKRKDVLRSADLPITWPAVHNLNIDHKNRLWISTITESEEIFQWWVLSNNGKLLAKFELPGRRSIRNVWQPKDVVVKDDFIYLIEQANLREAAKIIRYKIRFIERK